MFTPASVDMYMVSPSGVKPMPWVPSPAGALHTVCGSLGSLTSSAVTHIEPDDQYVLPSGEKAPSWVSIPIRIPGNEPRPRFSNRGWAQS